MKTAKYIVMLCLFSVAAAYGNWVQFYGDASNSGTAKGMSLDVTNMSTFNYRMLLDGSRISASPVIRDDTLFIGTHKGGFFARRSSDGSVIWTKTGFSGKFFGTAAIAEDKVIVGNTNDTLYGFATNNGDCVTTGWKIRLDGSIFADICYNPDYGCVYVGTMGGTLYKIKVSDGSIISSYTSPDKFLIRYSAAFNATYKRVVFPYYNGRHICILADESASAQFTFKKLLAVGYGGMRGAPTTSGSLIFQGTVNSEGKEGLYRVNISTYSKAKIQGLNACNTPIIETNRDKNPAVYSAHIASGDFNGIYFRTWSKSMSIFGGPEDAPCLSGLAMSDSAIVFMTEDGYLNVVKRYDNTQRVVYTRFATESATLGQLGNESAPALYDHHIFISTPEGYVLRYGTAPSGITDVAGQSKGMVYHQQFEVNADAVRFSVNQPSPVDLKVYDLRGRLIGTIFKGFKNAGTFIQPAGQNMTIGKGVYIYRLKIGNKEFLTTTSRF